jgi:hypothetical protein
MKVSDGIFYTEPQGKGTKIAPVQLLVKLKLFIYSINGLI